MPIEIEKDKLFFTNMFVIFQKKDDGKNQSTPTVMPKQFLLQKEQVDGKNRSPVYPFVVFLVVNNRDKSLQ